MGLFKKPEPPSAPVEEAPKDDIADRLDKMQQRMDEFMQSQAQARQPEPVREPEPHRQEPAYKDELVPGSGYARPDGYDDMDDIERLAHQNQATLARIEALRDETRDYVGPVLDREARLTVLAADPGLAQADVDAAFAAIGAPLTAPLTESAKGLLVLAARGAKSDRLARETPTGETERGDKAGLSPQTEALAKRYIETAAGMGFQVSMGDAVAAVKSGVFDVK